MNAAYSEGSKYARTVLRFLGFLVILAVALSMTGGVQAQEPIPAPFLIGFPENDAVEGWEWPVGATVTLTIDNAPPGFLLTGAVGVRGDGDTRTYIRFDFPELYNLDTGDVVSLTDGVTQKSYQVKYLAVTGIDETANAISGLADAGVEVQVWPHGFDQTNTVLATAGTDGTWTADFGAGFDLLPGVGGRSQIFDPVSGDATAVDWTVPEPPPTLWRDEFEGAVAGDWYWPNGEHQWSLEEAPGFLRLYTSDEGTPTGNLLLRDVSPGDFTIKTHLAFEPYSNFQFAGLVIYQDGENWLQFGRAFCDVENFCAGNGIYFDKVLGGGSADGNFATAVNTPNEAFLRLERRGEMVRALFSFEGITWTEIGTHWIPPEFVVNQVGMVASQDFDSEMNVPADFDFFELSEGWNFLPEGFHDGAEGDVVSWNCVADGWAADPDDRLADLAISIAVDGAEFPPEDWIYAANYREDLDAAGICVDGNCAFNASLWDKMTRYEPHSLTTFAQDVPTGEWVQLSASPKEMACRSYDIYAFNTETGETSLLTPNLTDSDEYNPVISPNGKKVAHHVVTSDGWYGTRITDLKTGITYDLPGLGYADAEPAWSPSGRWIAFDRQYTDQGLYILPAGGGSPVRVRENAHSADWAPNSRRIVFHDMTDGSIRTIPVDGGTGGETIIAAQGMHPEWSPDGAWITFDSMDDIWKVHVNMRGEPLSEPVQLTSLIIGEGRPTWSPDSQTIVYHGGFTNDYDLWSVPAAGGEPVWLNGAPGGGDYDPSYASSGPLVLYSSFSPAGLAPRHWISGFTYNAGTWDAGEHIYHFETTYSVPEPGYVASGERILTSTYDAPEYPGYTLLRPFGLRAFVDGSCPQVDTIQPTQETRFSYAWVTDWAMTYVDAQAYYAGMTVTAVWDDNLSAVLERRDLYPFTAWFDTDSYICTHVW